MNLKVKFQYNFLGHFFEYIFEYILEYIFVAGLCFVDLEFLELLKQNSVPFFFFKAILPKDKTLYIVCLTEQLYKVIFKPIFRYCAIVCNKCICANFDNSKYSIIFKQHLLDENYNQLFYVIFESHFKNIKSFLKRHPFDYNNCVYLAKDNHIYCYNLKKFYSIFKDLKKNNTFYC